ncbi:DNA/RNA non-specific endonuclease [Streptomyces cinereoruber]|uniref:DNA/RNA non-specific endonuclease n=1 Tax=Streptomyces cinereoruber TaxID=67260 RepID=UPI00345DFFAD
MHQPAAYLPLRGNHVSGTLTCSNPGAGPLYAAVAARVQAQAQADADRCGCKVRLTYPLRASTLIDARALAAVEAKQLLDQARKERDNADCKPGTGTGAHPAAWHPGTSSPAPAPHHAAPAVWQPPATALAAASRCPDPTWGGRVTFLRDRQGRLHEMNATLTRDMLDKGTEASRQLRPPGFSGGAHNQARGHLLANRLGGSGDTLDNLFTITQNPTNSPKMRDYEGKIYGAVAAGEKVTYNVYLEYANSNAKIPKYIQLEAVGDRGFELDVVLENPAHKQE